MVYETEIATVLNGMVSNMYLMLGLMVLGFALLAWTHFIQSKQIKEAIATILASDPVLTKKVRKTIKDQEVENDELQR